MPNLVSVMGSSLAIAARYTTTLVYSAKERPLRPKYTLEGEYMQRISSQTFPQAHRQTMHRFVEMLESHHSLVVKALQKLYKFCVNNEGFPGDPLAEAPDGHPLTHAILDRLGLIKQAEENADEPDEDSEDLRYLRLLSTSTECSVTAEPSPEPATPPEPSPISRPTAIPTPVSVPNRTPTTTSWQWDPQPVHQTSYSYPDAGYHDLMVMQQRSSMSAPDMGADIAHIGLPSGPSGLPHIPQHAHLEPPFPYVLDGCCDPGTPQHDVKPVLSRLPSGLMAESHSHPHHLGNLSVEMMGDYNFQHDPAYYPGFTPGWNFPSG